MRVYTHASLRAKTERVAKAISYRSWSRPRHTLQVQDTNIQRERETKPHKIVKVKSTIVVCIVYSNACLLETLQDWDVVDCGSVAAVDAG